MNRHCNGTLFSIGSDNYYYCIRDGKVFLYAGELKNGKICKNCQRPIAAETVVPRIRAMIQVSFTDGTSWINLNAGIWK
jgi:hypothetical protein